VNRRFGAGAAADELAQVPTFSAMMDFREIGMVAANRADTTGVFQPRDSVYGDKKRGVSGDVGGMKADYPVRQEW